VNPAKQRGEWEIQDFLQFLPDQCNHFLVRELQDFRVSRAAQETAKQRLPERDG